MRFIPMSSVAGKPISTKTLGDGSIAIDVALVDASGNQITSFGGGAQYTEGTIVPGATGTVILAKDALTPNLLDPLLILQADVSILGSSLRGDDGTILDWGGSNTGNGLGAYIFGEKLGGGWNIIPGDTNPVNGKVGLNVQAMPYDSSPFTVKGQKTHNAAIPGSDNVGALTGLFEISPSGGTDGRLGLPSLTTSGDLRITLDGEAVSIAGTVDTELPTAAALADGESSTPVVPRVGSLMMGMSADGSSTMDRARLVKTFDGDTASGTQYLLGVSPRFAASGGSVANTVGSTIDSRIGLDVQQSTVALKTLVQVNSSNAGDRLGANGNKRYPTSGFYDLDGYVGVRVRYADGTVGTGGAALFMRWSDDNVNSIYDDLSGGPGTNNFHKAFDSIGSYKLAKGIFVPKEARYVSFQWANGATAMGSTYPNVAELEIFALPAGMFSTVVELSGASFGASIPVNGYIDPGTGLPVAGQPVNVGGVDSLSAPTSVQGVTVSTLGEMSVKGLSSAKTATYIVTAEAGAASATLTNTAVAASSTQIAASSSSRKGMAVHNDSSEILYLKYGTSASNTSYTFKIAPGDMWVMPMPLYTGAVTGIAGVATGNWRSTTW